MWYVKDAEREYGPYRLDQLAEFLQPIHLVRDADAADWTAAIERKDLSLLFREDRSRELQEKTWYVVESDGEEAGPYHTDSIKELFMAGRLHLSTFIRYEEWIEPRTLGSTAIVQDLGGRKVFQVSLAYRTPKGHTGVFRRIYLSAGRAQAEAEAKRKLLAIAAGQAIKVTETLIDEGPRT